MRYETFNPSRHDIFKVASLVYDVDFRTFDLFFKSSEDAIRRISETLRDEDSDTFLVILDDDDEIIGILIYCISRFPNRFSFKSFRLLLVDILDYFVLCDVKPGDFYIADLAFLKSLRGQGLGSRAISDIIEYAKNEGLNRVILDCDFRNVNARKLYGKMGFEVFNKKRVKIGRFERGMYNMEFKIKR